MVIAVLVPEYLVGKALNDWLASRYNSFLFDAGPWVSEAADWEPVHGYYANLGGFVLDFTDIEDAQNTPSKGAELVQVTPPQK
jgi:hypothetical protein